MARPSNYPEWNTGGANNVEPSSGKKILGNETNEKPSSSYFNWWMKLVYSWVKYIGDFSWGEPLEVSVASYTGTNINGITGTGKGTGAGIRGDGGANSGPGLYGVGGSTNGRGVWGVATGGGNAVHGDAAGSGSGVKGVNSGAGPGVMGTTSGSGAAGDFEAEVGYGVYGSTLGNKAGVRGDGGTGSTAYGVEARKGSGTEVGVYTNGWVQMQGATNPASTDSLTNMITPANITKAAARIKITGGGSSPGNNTGTATIQVMGGCNVASPAISGGDTGTLNFVADFASDDACVCIMQLQTELNSTNTVVIRYASSQSGVSFYLSEADGSGGETKVNFDTLPAIVYVHLIACGLQ